MGAFLNTFFEKRGHNLPHEITPKINKFVIHDTFKEKKCSDYMIIEPQWKSCFLPLRPMNPSKSCVSFRWDQWTPVKVVFPSVETNEPQWKSCFLSLRPMNPSESCVSFRWDQWTLVKVVFPFVETNEPQWKLCFLPLRPMNPSKSCVSFRWDQWTPVKVVFPFVETNEPQ